MNEQLKHPAWLYIRAQEVLPVKAGMELRKLTAGKVLLTLNMITGPHGQQEIAIELDLADQEEIISWIKAAQTA